MTIRDIVEAAGQRNNASLHYHFGSKEVLVAELLIDGARTIDAARQAMLDEMEANGETVGIRRVVEALVHPVLRLTEVESRGNTYIRFVANLQMNHRALFRSTLGDEWNAGYRRCVKLARDLLADFPTTLLEQRISMMGIYSNALFAAKEAAADDGAAPNRFWTPAYTTDNIIDTLQAVLECTPSASTLGLAASPRPRRNVRDAGVGRNSV